MNWSDAHAAAEGILFAAGAPVPLDLLAQVLKLDRAEAEGICRDLAADLADRNRGVRVIRLEDSFQMVSAPQWGEQVRAILTPRKPAKLSAAALETLSVIAYCQPVTRAYVDQFRGVDSAYTVGLLQDRDLIEECGRLEVPGRPILYRTTQQFLRVFGLAALDELPPLTKEVTPETAQDGREGGKPT